MADAVDLSLFVRHREDGAAFVELAVDGIKSPEAIDRIEGGLESLSGVLEARLNYTSHRVKITWRNSEVDPAVFMKTMQDLGYRAYPHIVHAAEEAEIRKEKWMLRCLGIAGFASMNIMLLSVAVWSGNATEMATETRDLFHWISALIALPAVAYAGQPFFRSAFAALHERRLNMDVPIVVGILLALVMSVYETMNHARNAYFDSGVMLLFFLLCGRCLDQAMRRRTRAVAGNLAALKSETALRLDDRDQAILVPVGALSPGDRILVRPGDRIAVDGVVLKGSSEIDESLVTGETTPRRAEIDSRVYAGSTNFGAVLTLRATAVGEDTLLDEIERLLDNAASSKSRYVRLADKVASAYAPVIHIAAAMTFVVWLAFGASFHDAILTAVAVLIITCPCALALAVPVVQVVASGAMFRCGILLNSGDAIERMARVDTVVFDKTGTLTMPEQRVANRFELEPELLEVAACLALSSRHPLALAVAAEAVNRTPVDGAEEVTGQGVRAVIDGIEARLGSPAFCGMASMEKKPENADVSLVAVSFGDRKAILHIRQELRPDAVETITLLKRRGVAKLRIMSGDRPEAVRPIAEALGIVDWQAGMTPAEKIEAIKALQREGASVLMVGDGLNDAPALAAADVSLSPISAADLAQVHADAVFLGERLRPAYDAIIVSRKSRLLMRQNLAFALVYNLIAVPLAFLGYVTPLVAALAMSGSSLVVTLNGLRARYRSHGGEAVSPKAVAEGKVKDMALGSSP